MSFFNQPFAESNNNINSPSMGFFFPIKSSLEENDFNETTSPKTLEQYELLERAIISLLDEEVDPHIEHTEVSINNSHLITKQEKLDDFQKNNIDHLNGIDIDQIKNLITIYINEGNNSDFIHTKL